MIFLAIFLILAGLAMLLKPQLIWGFTERWKSDGSTEPSTLYVWSIRFGGAFCLIIGLASGVSYWMIR